MAVDVATGGKVVVAKQRASWADDACWRADGRLVALTTGRAPEYVAYAPGQREVLGPAGWLNHVAFDPGCTRAAELSLDAPSTGEPGAVVKEIGGPTLLELSSYWPVEGHYMAWSADGSLIADLDDTGRRQAVRVTEVATGRTLARRRIPTYFGTIGEGAFAPDRSAVVFNGDSGSGPISTSFQTVTIFDLATRTFRELVRVRRMRNIFETAWSPRGDRLAVVIDERIHLFGLDGRHLGVAAPGARARTVAWSPDGASIAFGRSRRLPARRSRFFPVRRWAIDLAVVAAEPGARARILHRDLREQVVPAWSPDGARLAVFDSRR